MVLGGMCLVVVINGALNADGYIRDVLQEDVVPLAPPYRNKPFANSLTRLVGSPTF